MLLPDILNSPLARAVQRSWERQGVNEFTCLALFVSEAVASGKIKHKVKLNAVLTDVYDDILHQYALYNSNISQAKHKKLAIRLRKIGEASEKVRRMGTHQSFFNVLEEIMFYTGSLDHLYLVAKEQCKLDSIITEDQWRAVLTVVVMSPPLTWREK